jgi:ribosomal protein S18 acetylase RimI-like enzyme
MAENPLWQRYGVNSESACRRLSEGQEQNATILVAGPPGEPAGFVWYVEKGAFSRSGYVMLIGVDPALQGQKVGEALMDKAESLMFGRSQDVFLLVSDFNERAQRFYRRRGYELVGALPGYILADISELIFRKIKP